MENKEQDGFDSGRGSSSNPIWLPEVIVYGKRPLPWYNRALNGVAKFVNDEIFLNKDNIRAKNARRHPRAMDAVQEGGNIAGAIAAAPFAAYTAVQVAPVIMPALKVAGQAVTPSTWIGGLAQATGYQAPAWLLNGADLAASAYYANEAGKDIDKNGLTWKTGFNALMSLAPMTRETEAIEGVANTLRRPAQAVNSVVDDFRAARNAVSSSEAVLGREFSRSVKNAQFINVPVEHVSPNGMTKGSALDVGEEGIHLSPVGSSTTATIQQKTGYPFVRIGTWTFSNNTRPVEVQDVGYFGRGFNPEFDAKVNRGVTNFKYTNNFEGKGNTSYLTMEPNSGLQLSKNIETPVNKLEQQIGKIYINKPTVTTNESLGQTILEGNYPVELDVVPIRQLDGTFSNTMVRRVPKYLISTEIDPHIIKIQDTFNSDFYRHRLSNAGVVDVKQQDEIIQKLIDNIKNTNFYSISLPKKSTAAFTQYRNGKHEVIFNRTPLKPTPLAYDIHHEVGGHVAEVNIPEIQKFNQSLIEDWKNKLLVPYEDNKETLDYMFKVYSDGTWEGRGMLAPTVYQMKRKGLTGEQILQDRYAKTDFHLDNFRAAMGDEWTANVLNKLLVLTPFIYGRNNTQRSESSKVVD